jgi:predicted dienelactone hydrolase
MKLWILTFLLLISARFVGAETTAPLDLDWKDEARGRAVPVRVYLPAEGKPAPVVIFSHGLGGSREGYSYLGRYWSEHGYVAVHVQHVGSDRTVWKGAALGDMKSRLTAAANPKENLERIKDVEFTLDQLTTLNRDETSPLHGRLDLDHIAIAGHSFGGYTAEALSGELLGGTGQSHYDSRIKCAIVMSPSPPLNADAAKVAFSKIAMPVLHMTGTKDDSPIGQIRAKDRRVPYDSTTAADQYLVIFADGDHMIFAGIPRQRPIDQKDQPMILKATTAFLDAYLKGDVTAKKYLQEQFKTDAGADATFEMK